MGITKQDQLEEISADYFIRERADRLRNEYERKLQECVEDAAIEADMDREMEKLNGRWC
jgi:1,2-phenylacetyl-CoA epoxidase catalytic subunit